MCASLDRRDDRHANVGDVFQNLSAFVVNLTPNGWIGDVAERGPIDPNNEVPTCASQDHDLVLSILSNPVKCIDNLRVMECRESARPTVSMKLDDQHAPGISRQLQTAVSSEVVISKCLHNVLLHVFARTQPAPGAAPNVPR